MPLSSKSITLGPLETSAPAATASWTPTLDTLGDDDSILAGATPDPIWSGAAASSSAVSAASPSPLVGANGSSGWTGSWNPLVGANAAYPFAFGKPDDRNATAAGAPPSLYDTVTVKTTGITFNLEFVKADNPTAAFETDVENAAKLLSTAMQNQITVNLHIGFGEVDGESLTDGSAAAGADNSVSVSYSSLRSDLIASAPSGDTNFNALPTGSTIGGQSQVDVWNSEAKALGLISANDATTDDGSAGFATDISDASMVGVALHEMTHAMGRVPDDNADVMELFRFSSAGVHVFTNATPGPQSYFSVDGGVTRLADYGQDSDPSDFANSNYGTPLSTLTPNDPFNQYYDSSTLQTLTQVDLTQLNVLGFNTFGGGGGSGDTTPPSVVHDGPVSVVAGSTVVLSSSELEFDDNVSTHAQETYAIVTAPADGTLLKSGAATTTFTQADIDNGLISYKETVGAASSDSFGFTVTDAADNATTSQTFPITIAAATPPSLIHDGPISVADGATVVISATQLEFDDSVSTHAQETYAIVTAQVDGTLLKSGVATTTFTQADIDNGLISYQATNADASSDSFSFTVTDAAGRATATQKLQITILDTTPPSLIHDVLDSVAAGRTVAISSSQLEFDDNVSTHLQETYTIVTAPADGTLLKSGVATTTFTQADIDNGLISYQETAANASSDSFTYTVTDAAGNTTAAEQFKIAITLESAVFYDFNGDGKADILFRTTSGEVDLWLSNTSGSFTHVDVGAVATSSKIVGVGDFDGDGKADVLWKDKTNGDLTEWLSNGSGGFTHVDIGTALAGSHVAGIADFNGDGAADILWSDASGALTLWDSNGTGGFTHESVGTASASLQVAGIGDFNGDGDADLLFRSLNGALKLWESNATGGFTHDNLGTLSTNWTVAGVGDFNDDGKADILFRNVGGAVKLWESNGSGGFTHQSLGTMATNWQVAGVGDFNGDGKADILWKNASGAVTLWDSNASGGFTHDSLGTVAAGWTIQGG